MVAIQPLNDRQIRFAEEYLKDLNATAAAIRAGYSPKGAEVQGHRLLSHVKVKELIDAGKAKRAEQTDVTKNWLVQRLVTSFEQAHAGKSYAGVGRLGELLSRLHGYIEDKSRVRVVRSLEDLSDDELAALAQSERQGEDTRH